MYKFDAEVVKNRLVQWIRDWFEVNGKGCNAVIGLSGGCDSTVITGLCVEALGADRVITVSMPDIGQDEHGADEIAKFFGVHYSVVNIGNTTTAIMNSITDSVNEKSVQTVQNIPPRVRMTTLYAVSQSSNGRVIGTDNASEAYLSYSTRWGDNVADCMPILDLTKSEVIQIGLALGIPEKWVKKIPSDDLPHSTSDENKFGFSYAELDEYIRTGKEPEGYCTNSDTTLKIDKIKKMYNAGKFKNEPIPYFKLQA